MSKSLLRNNTNNNLLILVIVLAVVSYFFHLGKTPVYILDEAKNAQCAREMMLRSDWITPTFNNELRTDKPPLHYFFMICAYKLFGVNEFSARFFSAVFGVFTVLILFWFTRRFLGVKTAFFAALVWLVSINLNLEFHLAVPDPYLIFFVSTALFSVYTFLETKSKGWLYLFYAMLGCGALTKGPVALVLPGLIVLIFLLFQHQFTIKMIVGELQPFVGLLIVLLIAAPWYIAVHIATDSAWTKGFFMEHNFNRFSEVKEGHGGFFGLTAIFVFIGLLPFSTFIVQTVKQSYRTFGHPFIQFCCISALVYVGFFTISETKLPNYTMPAYPFCAVLIGNFLSAIAQYNPKSVTLSSFFNVILFFALPIALYFIIRSEVPIRNHSELAWWFSILTAGAIFSLWYFNKSEWDKGIYVMATAFICMNLLFMGWIYPKVYSENPVSRSKHLLDSNSPICAYKRYNPAFNFYLAETVQLFDDKESLRRFLQENPNARVITRKEFEKDLSALKLKVLFEGKDLFESPVSVILAK